jgi:two-component system, NtrC family, sensor kinase
MPLQPHPDRLPHRLDSSRVLVVEDDDELRATLQRVLARFLPGVSIVTARDAQGALSVLEKQPVNLVLADYRLPRTDGLALMETLRERFPGVQRVMMTGDPDHDLAIRATQEAGVQRFFVKPFRLEALARSLDLMLKTGRAAP